MQKGKSLIAHTHEPAGSVRSPNHFDKESRIVIVMSHKQGCVNNDRIDWVGGGHEHFLQRGWMGILH